MSLAAMAWVWDQDVRPSSIKFVLIALADCAGQNGDNTMVWPSIPSICEKTSQDRKTVIAALDTLEAMGLLADTGQRCGSTYQVKVYRLVGMPTGITTTTHYTYRLTDKATGHFYIGVRSCSGKPEEDRYMGSGKWPTSKNHGPLTKEILGTYPTRAEAEVAEIHLIREHGSNELCKNQVRMGKTVLFQKECRISAQTVPEIPTKSPESGTRNRKEPLNEPSLIPEVKTPDDPLAEEADRFVAWFVNLLAETEAPTPKLTDSLRAAWRDTYAKMRRLDGREKEQIASVCRWARNDGFWKANFLSPMKLRGKNPDGVTYFDVFLNRMNQPQQSTGRAFKASFA